MVLMTEEQRTRLYDNLRIMSNCVRRRNLTRARRRRNFHIYIDRMYREPERPADVWRHYRNMNNQQNNLSNNRSATTEEECECSDDDDDDEEEEPTKYESDSEADIE